jgi:hypothetical protein
MVLGASLNMFPVSDGTLAFSLLEIELLCPSKCADGIRISVLLLYHTNDVQIRKHHSAMMLLKYMPFANVSGFIFRVGRCGCVCICNLVSHIKGRI